LKITVIDEEKTDSMAENKTDQPPGPYPFTKGITVRLLSPLGQYPAKTFLSPDAAMVVTDEICAMLVRYTANWDFSEVDSLAPEEIPILATMLLCVKKDQPRILPYPTDYFAVLPSEGGDADLADAITAQRALDSFIQQLKQEYRDDLASLAHKPPMLGGGPYCLIESAENDNERMAVLLAISASNPVTLRGLACLVKANMAWEHAELREAACISLWIALDASFSLVLERLKASGINNPGAKDAARYISDNLFIWKDAERYFEDDYENRIRFIHPLSRFGAEARPWLIADDFYELRDALIMLYYFLLTRQRIDLFD
jgi:hypothetical protein